MQVESHFGPVLKYGSCFYLFCNKLVKIKIADS